MESGVGGQQRWWRGVDEFLVYSEGRASRLWWGAGCWEEEGVVAGSEALGSGAWKTQPPWAEMGDALAGAGLVGKVPSGTCLRRDTRCARADAGRQIWRSQET